MKTIIVTIAAALMSLNAAALDLGNDPSDYCVTKKNGKTVVEYKGKAITKDVTLKDGTKIKSNGTVVLANGSSVKLKDGECINEDKISDEIRSRAGDKDSNFDMDRSDKNNSDVKKEGEDRWDKSKDFDQPKNDQKDMDKKDSDPNKDMDVSDPDRNKDQSKDQNKNSDSDWQQKDYNTHHPDSLKRKSLK